MNTFVRHTGLWLCTSLIAACGTEDTSSDTPETPESRTGAIAVAPGAGVAAPGGLQRPQVRVPEAEGAATAGEPAATATPGPTRGPVLAPVDERLIGVYALADDFPWGKGEDGNWQGTGEPDPEPLRNVSNEEIMAAARGEKGDLNDRRSALVSAARRHLPGALDMAGAVLLDTGMDLMSRQVALSALIEHGGGGALSLMWRAFQDPNDRIRAGAVWAIALYGTAEAKKVITAALKDPHPGVKGAAILALTAVRNDEVFLRTVLESTIVSSEQPVYQEAAYVLAALADARAVKVLSEQLDRATGNELKRRTLRHYLRAAYQKRAAAGSVAFPRAD